MFYLRDDVGFLSDHMSFERHLKQLQVCFLHVLYYVCHSIDQLFVHPFILYICPFQSGIERIFNGARLKNSEAMEVILKAAISKAIGGCVQLSHMKVI